MRRRRLLAALAGSAGSVALAGCSAPFGSDDDAGGGSDGDARGSGTRTGGDATATPTPPSGGRPALPVPEDDLFRAAPRDGIPAIVEPEFGPDWDGIEVELRYADGERRTYRPTLTDDDRVVGVARNGVARAYPLKVLRWHEVVNDTAGGEPLVVTYCPVCKSAVAAVRRVGSAVPTFGVSGYLYRRALVLYDDATDSLWSQLLALAIRGDATGRELSLVPASVTTWGAWRDAHDDATVLQVPPETVVGEVAVNYRINFYTEKQERLRSEHSQVYGSYGAPEFTDTRLPERAVVLGVAAGDAAVAYPVDALRAGEVVVDRVGERPVVVALAPDGSPVAWDRRVAGRTLDVTGLADGHLVAGGSRWDLVSGRAVDGPLAGETLRAATATPPMYWFAWLSTHPETTVYGR